MKKLTLFPENKGKKVGKRRRNWSFLFFLFSLSFFLFSCYKGFILPSALFAQTPGFSAGHHSNEHEPPQPFEQAIEGTQKLEGLFTLYRNQETGKVYLEITPEQLNKQFLCFITLESGLGEAGILSGLPAGDVLFQLRRVRNNVQFVIPNINFRTHAGDPQESSVARSFSDSILYSLPIKSIHPKSENLLIDLSDLLLSERRDLPGIASLLPMLLGASYSIEPDKSYIQDVKAFPLNLEISSVYGFSSTNDSELAYLPSVPDSRAFNLRVHYSFSEVPTNNGYRPRSADERVGYFLTAYKDFSDRDRAEPFVRYINRWNLQKLDPSAPLSPPVKPIVFWIENTVPMEYRKAIEEGILLWNKAFEKAGFINAIQVKQMPDKANWDPADVRYNTIRWSSSFDPAFAGVGPTRVNPLTGEILDADIVLDANIVRLVKQGYRTLVNQNQAMAKAFQRQNGTNGNPCQFGTYSRYLKAFTSTEGEGDLPMLVEQYQQHNRSSLAQFVSSSDLCFGMESQRQFAIGAMALSLLENVPPNSADMDEYIQQYLRYLAAHEVGHTLGLRHNFHGSTLLKPEELNDTAITRTKGLVGSVMDYVAINIAPPGTPQGDYFPTIVGPYDEWAIEYGYTLVNGVPPLQEGQILAEIAQRAPDPQLSYAADEDAFDFLNPSANTFDLSNDMLRYSQWQLDHSREMWKRLEGRVPTSEGYSELRAMFDTVFSYYFQQVMNATLYIGGQSFNRTRPDDPSGRPPFELISADKQREALTILDKYVFAEGAFNFSPDLLNKLAPSRWEHWGNPALVFPLDYPIGDRVTFLQRFVLRSLLSSIRLTRLRDAELKTTSTEKAFKLPELFETLQQSIWTEVFSASDKPVPISNFRRSLQREHLNILTNIVLRKTGAPEDAKALAWSELRELRDAISKAIRKEDRKADAYTRAHLEEARDRITKALNAQLQSN